jgi:chromate reductase
MTTTNDTSRLGINQVDEARTVDVVALSGSLRTGSLNTRLLNHAQQFAPAGMRVHIFAALSDIPHFNEDLESPAPAAARRLRRRILASDGLLIATPEYNASLPGVLKNALDWLSRPGDDGTQPLSGKPTAIMGASKGPFGSIRSQVALRQVLQKTGASVVAQPEVAVPFGDQRLPEDGQPDEVVAALLTQLLSELGVLIERSTVSTS